MCSSSPALIGWHTRDLLNVLDEIGAEFERELTRARTGEGRKSTAFASDARAR